ncbi:uncharacterized protein SOCEGT47_069960 [Sorangium cellulosum]|jgi:hypothetical protein|uniref:Prevent-host-death protein n=1 Tax=Sorangium cellulosum TaxID=56 RepID=A0A4P2Q9Y0_SORCE|nr:hypothetical protein [Sorangium cellulosum]AUX26434.1 uncharacterized protein SOCEGT47_069960 [Sorangium cellulosum]
MQAAKVAIVIPADRRVQLQLPADLPEGPAEVIVLVTSQRAAPIDRRAALGMDRGKVQIADDFDAPLPEDVQRAFDGET